MPINNETGKELDFVDTIAEKVLTYLQYIPDTSIPTVKLASLEEIHKAFNEAGTPIDLTKDSDPSSLLDLKKAADLILQYSVRSGSPLFNNQLYGTPDLVGIAGEYISTALNNNTHTYEVAPVCTSMEKSLVQKFAQVVGYHNEHDGLFLPGGSICNQYGMHLARFNNCPETKQKGNSAVKGQLVAFTSSDSHYSYLKAVNLLGLGTDSLVKVPSVNGRLDPVKLDQAIAKSIEDGNTPFFVGGTAGTTVLGAFDDFKGISDVCKKYKGVWFHIDASWGGGAFFSNIQHIKDLVAGVELSDSVCWNPHKIAGAPLQCSIFLTSHGQDILKRANGANATYLFQPDKNNSNLDVGDKTLHCGRRGDAIKLWLMWRALGDKGLSHRVDTLINLIEYMSSRINTIVDEEGRRCFLQVHPTTYSNLCFYAIPKSLRVSKPDVFDPTHLSESNLQTLKEAAPAIKSQMQHQGLALIGFQPIGALPNCWRMVAAGAKENLFTQSHIDEILDSMVKLSNDL